MVKSFTHVDDTERRLVKKMLKEKFPWLKIQKITGRSPDTINAILKSTATKGAGAPTKLDGQAVKKILTAAEALSRNANAQQEITLPMILKKDGYNVCEKTVRKVFRSENVAFYKLKEKPLPEDRDVKDRRAWTGSARVSHHNSGSPSHMRSSTTRISR